VQGLTLILMLPLRQRMHMPADEPLVLWGAESSALNV